MTTWAVLDCHYLCHRAFHTTGDLKYGGLTTGTLFGFFSSLITLERDLPGSKFIFCFDRKPYLRAKVFSDYKLRPEETDEDELRARNNFQREVRILRRTHLKEVGFRNVFSQKGYEADDIIASVCNNLPDGDNAVIVSSDKDLYQLLSKRVCMYNPLKKQTYTMSMFIKEYGIEPTQWIQVKSIAGCKSDGVPGVKGIGELTATRFLRGLLKEGSIVEDKILKSKQVWKKNIELIKLPYPGCKTFKLREDEVTEKKWCNFCNNHGMKSLIERLA